MIVTSQKNPKSEAVKTEPDAESTQDVSDDVDDVTADEAEDQDEGGLLRRKRPDAERRNRPRKQDLRQYLRRSVLPLLLVASLAVSGFLGWRQWQDHRVRLAGEQAQQAAIAYAQVLTSIDSNKVDENFRQVLDGATGEFKDM